MGAILSAAQWVLWWLLSVVWSSVSWCLNPVPLTIGIVTTVLIYRYIARDLDFWPSRGVRCVPPKLFWGHDLGKDLFTIDQRLHDEYHGKEGYTGYMELIRPALHVSNPDLIKDIFIKDFEHFTDRRTLAFNEDFMLMIQFKNGREWKDLRSALTPSFSGSKLKAMHQLCLDNADNLSNYMLNDTKNLGKVDIKEAFGRFTIDNIASCAFGLECNSFANPDSDFSNYAKVFSNPLKGYALLRIMLLMLIPNWLVFRTLPDPYKTPINFFKHVTGKMIQHRKQSGSTRRDFLQLLMETKDKNGDHIINQDSIVMNSVLFFIAGYDTTATLLTFCSYALATTPECQNLLLKEIDDVLESHDGQLTYEAINEMTYLDQVTSETLRLYPVGIRLERKCSRNYTLAGTTVQIPRGLLIQVPVFAIHRDPRYYPDPLKFDPDRFLPAAKAERHPCVYLPFGAGPRNCIAMRFALFEAKVALVAVLRNNRLEPTDDTPPPPLPIDKSAFLLKPKEPLHLKVVPRK